MITETNKAVTGGAEKHRKLKRLFLLLFALDIVALIALLVFIGPKTLIITVTFAVLFISAAIWHRDSERMWSEHPESPE